MYTCKWHLGVAVSYWVSVLLSFQVSSKKLETKKTIKVPKNNITIIKTNNSIEAIQIPIIDMIFPALLLFAEDSEYWFWFSSSNFWPPFANAKPIMPQVKDIIEDQNGVFENVRIILSNGKVYKSKKNKDVRPVGFIA